MRKELHIFLYHKFGFDLWKEYEISVKRMNQKLDEGAVLTIPKRDDDG